jgi:hypothetical protein
LLAVGADPNARTTVVPDDTIDDLENREEFTLVVTPLMYAPQKADCIESI